MTENGHNSGEDSKTIAELLKEVEKRVMENRSNHNDSDKAIKDFRRIFDQVSSKMNQAIFNNAPAEEIYQETLRTVSILIEILLRTKK